MPYNNRVPLHHRNHNITTAYMNKPLKMTEQSQFFVTGYGRVGCGQLWRGMVHNRGARTGKSALPDSNSPLERGGFDELKASRRRGVLTIYIRTISKIIWPI